MAKKHLSMKEKIAISKDKKLKKSESLFKQAFTHQDQETLIDIKSHLAALGSLPPELIEFGSKVLSVMKMDEITSFPIAGHVVKVRKNGPDLYTGWTEKGSEINHKFEKVSMPQLMAQLQSQLELYGKEKELAPKKDLTEVGQAISEAIDETREENEAVRQAKIKEKLDKLKGKINKEVIPIKEVLSTEQEDVCSACDEKVAACSCYSGLPAPRVEIDIKSGKINIFFQKSWSPEDKENFTDDLKRRASVLFKKRGM